jgi:ADP-ribose pyrophosphatase YjhB (NUDIX family)
MIDVLRQNANPPSTIHHAYYQYSMMSKRISGSSRRLGSLFGSSVATAALTLSSSSSIWLYATAAAENGVLRNQQAAFVHHDSSIFRRQRSDSFAISSTVSKRMIATDPNINQGDSFDSGDQNDWNDVLSYELSSHNSARIIVPDDASEDMLFDRSCFRNRLEDTVTALRELEKSSVWVHVPMARASLIEEMIDIGFEFHHAQGRTASLNLWLRTSESKVPEFATHHVGVGAVVVNSRDEILCVRELRRNFMPWKIPGGLSDLGEHISAAAEREVMEETRIPTKFHSILSFRQSHGLNNGRSDLFFVCRLDPIEETDESGNAVIPVPVPQECEIEAVEWIPLSEFKSMVRGTNENPGHPMMSHVMDVYEKGLRIKQRTVQSVVPGREFLHYEPDTTGSEL